MVSIAIPDLVTFPRSAGRATPVLSSPGGTSRLRVDIAVNDVYVREALKEYGAFDGQERPFAWLPRLDGSYQKIPLCFVRSESVQGFMLDRYSVQVAQGDLDYSKMTLLGVAVGMDTNVGELWLQKPDANWPVLPG